MSEDFEELEQIPWAALAATPGDPRGRFAAIAVGAIALLGVVLYLSMRGPEPVAVLSATQPPPTGPVSPTAAAPVAEPPTTTAAPSVISEADLMLIDVGDEERLAVMHAEWLVRDYLTVDGDERVADRVELLIPGGESRVDAASYVEWARAFSVASPEPGHYRVEVLYRVLIDGSEGFVRQPAAALAVDLAVDVDGAAKLLNVPEPVPVPPLRGLDT